ncbi:MAG TPA: triphosphoribosyl-dephospho-CoA synthase [Ignisphaera aggregans]|uniref:Triphosphoribosyl-dephospho-CoA synthase n=1 Tax=Ignisphaera aggregans TaxID=334771 RepID=A0A832YTN1_9CREN|nr:triphosphoribosyl-dephospho-CoA synthase [Ignisphaera aggregans]
MEDMLINAVTRLAMGLALEALGYPKPGNVHRMRNFSDTTLEDFVVSGFTAVFYLYKAARRGAKVARGEKPRVLLGDAISGMVSKAREVSGGGNTCLGTAILLVPLATALGYLYARDEDPTIDSLAIEATNLLKNYTTISDAIELYKAIRIASPSYLKPEDVTDPLPNVWDPQFAHRLTAKGYRLWHVLVYSAERDVVARETVSRYQFSREAARFLSQRLEEHGDWNRAVVETYLWVLSRVRDTIVALKHGIDTALEIRRRAAEILRVAESSWEEALPMIKQLDDELGARGINPGSSADIVATAIALYAVEKRCRIVRAGKCVEM